MKIIDRVIGYLKKNRETFSLTENKELFFVTFKKDNNTVTHSTHGLKLQQ